MKERILGVDIDIIDILGVMSRMANFVNASGQHYVVTVNPEFVVAAQKLLEFRDVLNKADIAICDGVGLRAVSGGKLIRVTGVDLVEKILAEKSEANFKVFLLGGYGNVAERLKDKYPTNIVGFDGGGLVDPKNWLLSDNEAVINNINNSGANIILVAFGQVKQEMWISKNLSSLPNVKVAIGVGGTFDYLSGVVKRAPAWMRVVGLEWLFRVVREPRRIGRIWNATVKFIWLIVKSKFLIL